MRRLLSAILFIGATAGQVLACGPWFPNRMLTGSDEALLVAPEATFNREIERMQLTAKPASHDTNGVTQHTRDAELDDLKKALANTGNSPERIEAILKQHASERAKIVLNPKIVSLRPLASNDVRIAGVAPKVTPGLPIEFANYFEGAVAWHAGKMQEARASWQKVLGLPAAQRPYKSTWAAYMLGKSWEADQYDRAIGYFQDVRKLAKAGFADSLGLVPESLGAEARMNLRQQRYAEAIELYLAQAATGDPVAFLSLRYAAALALRNPNAPLKNLASNNKVQRVITAYIISGGFRAEPVDIDGSIVEPALKMAAKSSYLTARVGGWHKFKAPGLLWLEAVESAKVKDVESAEELALAAYQMGQMEMAQRWINLAKETPVAQWVQAKLLLRAGKLDAATALLAKVSTSFELTPSTNKAAELSLFNDLYSYNFDSYYPPFAAQDQSRGELGVLRLVRRQYTEALDCLMRAGYWYDAVFVAERVLTTDELKTYVDRHWPAIVPEPPPPGRWARADFRLPVFQSHYLRDLLAHRLAREGRREEAVAYFPDSTKAVFQQFDQALKLTQQNSLPKDQRAKAWWLAAGIARNNGIQILATYDAPDDGLHDGSFEPKAPIGLRASSTNQVVIAATRDELDRIARHHPTPDIRYHYLYTAANYAWEAAKLMPDNSDDTARVLWMAGTWLKNRDAKAADVFYKALVRRCRRTALGAEADRKRWFPERDPSANITPAQPRTTI